MNEEARQQNKTTGQDNRTIQQNKTIEEEANMGHAAHLTASSLLQCERSVGTRVRTGHQSPLLVGDFSSLLTYH